jgi:type II secretory pathway component PulL
MSEVHFYIGDSETDDETEVVVPARTSLVAWLMSWFFYPPAPEFIV